jgi:hypothetical protein
MVRNFDSCGRNEVRTAEYSAPVANISPPHLVQTDMKPRSQ